MVNTNVLMGWDVTRGKTMVKMKNGIKGTITEWHGGYFHLSGNDKIFHRCDIEEWSNESLD